MRRAITNSEATVDMLRNPDIKCRKGEDRMKAVLTVIIALPLAYLALLLITAWL